MRNRISIHLKGLEALHWATNLPLSSFTMPFPYSPHYNTALYFNSVWKHLYIMWLKRYVNQRQQKFQQVLGWPTLDEVPYIIHIIYWNQLPWQRGYLAIKLLSYIPCVYFISYLCVLLIFSPLISSCPFSLALPLSTLACNHCGSCLDFRQEVQVWIWAWDLHGFLSCQVQLFSL